MVCHVLKQNDNGTGMPSSLRSRLQLITKAQLDESSAWDAVAKSRDHWTSLFIHILLFLRTQRNHHNILCYSTEHLQEKWPHQHLYCVFWSVLRPSLYCSPSIFTFLLRHPVNLLHHVDSVNFSLHCVSASLRGFLNAIIWMEGYNWRSYFIFSY